VSNASFNDLLRDALECDVYECDECEVVKECVDFECDDCELYEFDDKLEPFEPFEPLELLEDVEDGEDRRRCG